jgi:RNA polymerase sigma-70 factor (ECF subfamily)
MIIDERRSARFRNESGSADLERIYDRAGLDEMDSVLDRLLLSGALAQLSPLHRAVIRRSYYQGWTTAQIAADLDIAEGTVKSRLHYAMRRCRSHCRKWDTAVHGDGSRAKEAGAGCVGGPPALNG